MTSTFAKTKRFAPSVLLIVSQCVHSFSTKASAIVRPDINIYPSPPQNCPFTPTEWKQRCELAVSYRIACMQDWHMNIFNHITLKVAGSENETDGPHFLLNEYGLGFDEVTASNLLKVTLDGKCVPTAGEETKMAGRVFKPGYVLHSALHKAREDCHAIWHCHQLDSTAICQTTTGLLPLSQEATFALTKGISYHPFEGSANSVDEQERFVTSLGETNKILMLEDHGPLVVGKRIEEAFSTMWFLTRACQYQVRATSSVGGDLSRINIPSNDIEEEMNRRAKKFDDAPTVKVDEGEIVEKHDTEALMFACARRSAEREFGADNIYI